MLRDDINNAVKDAMKAKDERKVSTLRMVNSRMPISTRAGRANRRCRTPTCSAYSRR
jgi:hypothetical protein